MVWSVIICDMCGKAIRVSGRDVPARGKVYCSKACADKAAGKNNETRLKEISNG